MSRVDLVVVSGLHRSGTTFLANVLATAQHTRMLPIEPLNPEWGLRSATRWYPSSPSASQREVLADLRRLRRGQTVRWTPIPPPYSAAKSVVRGLQRGVLIRAARWSGAPVVLKDPFLSLSLEFVCAELTDRPVVVASRHPAAWAMSLDRVGWHPGELLDDLCGRPELSDALVGVPHRQWTDVGLLEASAWAWRILTARVREQIADLPEGSVIAVPLESLQDAPAERALGLLDQVGLDNGRHSAPAIRALTEGDTVVPSTTQVHVLQRDTRRSVDSWRSRLDPADQAMIWEICGEIAEGWYQL